MISLAQSVSRHELRGTFRSYENTLSSEFFKGSQQSRNPFAFPKGLACVSNELSSRSVSRQVLLPLQSLTSVFGMGTGGPSALKSLTKSVGSELSSRSVSRQVFLPQQSLTSVFGMGTGGPSALKSPTEPPA